MEKEIKEKKEEKNIYFRIRYKDGHEVSDIIPESRFNELYSDYELIEKTPVLILKAKE